MGADSGCELIDWHTHVWLPQHLGDEHRDEMAARTGRETSATPEEHQAAVSTAAKFAVIGIKWGRLGANVPNDFISDYVQEHADRAVGFACVDPNDRNAAGELERSVRRLGLRGLKLSPVYQGFHPLSPEAWAVYDLANDLGIPVMFHQAAAFATQSVLEYGNPVLLDKVARTYPNLRIILAHLGQPWVEETVQMLRKHKNVFSDLSARYYRRWQFYNAMRLALDYGVTDQLLFGSDFPMQTTSAAVDSFFGVNDPGNIGSLPPISERVIEDILYRRPLGLLGL